MKKLMDKRPSFRRFLFISVLMVQSLSLAVVIGFLFATLDQSMEKEYVNQVHVQQTELGGYLNNRLNHLKTRVNEISANNGIKVSMLLNMLPKVATLMEELYLPSDGIYFYLRHSSGAFYPQLTDSHAYLAELSQWPVQDEDTVHPDNSPSTIIFSVPIFNKEELLGQVIGLYDLADDPHGYNLMKAFGTLEVVSQKKDGFLNIYEGKALQLSKKNLPNADPAPDNRPTGANAESNLIPLQDFPSLFLLPSDEPLRQKKRLLISKLFFLCLPLFMLTVSVSFFVIRRMTATMNALAKNAQQIADTESESDLDEIQVKHSEFLNFTKAFNKVLAKVRRQTVTLKQVNEELKSEVLERTRITEALRESEAQLRSLQSNIPIGLIRGTFDGKIVFLNPKCVEIFGYETAEEMMAIPVESHFDSPVDYKHLQNRVAHEDVITVMEMRFRRKDGTLLWCALHLKKLHDASTNENFLDGAVLDVTYRKKIELEKQNLETQLRQAQKMEAIGTLAGGIAHDFNNILAAIDGFSELALDDAPKESLLFDNLKEIRIATKRASDLVKQILTFARQSEVEKRPVKFAIVLKETIKLLRSTIPSNIDIRSEIHTQKIIMADPTQLHQIIVNLCANAAHAMRAKSGILTIRLHETIIRQIDEHKKLNLMPGQYFILSIQDTGHGMSREVMERIFDPYFTTKDHGEGTGMGLSVAQGIIHSMRGTISVESAPDEGSVFSVYLPVLEKQSQPRESCDGPLIGGTERILMVDDETAITHMGRQTLERLGYRVTVRNSSLEALELFRNAPHRFDLVISDMAMPQMTGDHLAEEIMVMRPDIPVILCTGYSEQINQDQAIAKGIRALLLKPVVKHELAATIRKALNEMPVPS